MESHKGRILLADEMGTGKTLQTLAWLQLHPEIRPALIVCPQSVKLNWVKEAHNYTTIKNISIAKNGSTIECYHGKQEDMELLVCNYDLVAKHLETFSQMNFKFIACDESSLLKNPTTIRSKACRALAKTIPYVMCLSGTPIINRPIEIFTSLNMIAPNLFPNRFAFGKRYCGLHQTRFGMDWNGATNLQELNQLLKDTVMIRRKKEDVLKDLPQKIRSIVPIELSNHSEYFSAEKDFITWIGKNYGRERANAAMKAETLVKLEYLKQLSFTGKWGSIVDFIDDYFENANGDGKLIVFATHHSAIDKLMEYGCKYNSVKIDGTCSSEQRQKAVDQFQNDKKCQMFIGNIKAAGMGITLSASDTVMVVELPWTPGEMLQAEDRAPRIGNVHSCVNIHYLVADKSIELKMMNILDKKTKILSNVLDGKEADDSSLLTELLADYYEGEVK